MFCSNHFRYNVNQEPFSPSMFIFSSVFSREIRTYILVVLRKVTEAVAITHPVFQDCSRTIPTYFRVCKKSRENNNNNKKHSAMKFWNIMITAGFCHFDVKAFFCHFDVKASFWVWPCPSNFIDDSHLKKANQQQNVRICGGLKRISNNHEIKQSRSYQATSHHLSFFRGKHLNCFLFPFLSQQLL